MKKKYLKGKILLTIFVLMLSLSACQNTTEEAEPITEEQEQPTTNLEPTEEELSRIRREEDVVPLLDKAKQLALGYYYEEAIAILREVPKEFSQDKEVTEAIENYTQAMDSFVPYEQPVRHIFFHSLIVDTSRAFDGDYMSNGYNYWMTTVDEFYAILEELYANQYLLAMHIRAAVKANCQFIVSTHSPVLAAIPEADIIRIKDGAFERVVYEQLDDVAFLEMFMRRRAQLFADDE